MCARNVLLLERNQRMSFSATGILALGLFPPIFTALMLLLEHFLGLRKGRASAVSGGSAEAD